MSHPTTLLQATSRVNSHAEQPLEGSPSLEHPLPAKPDVRTHGDREWKRKRVDSQNDPRGGQWEDAGRAGHGRGNRRALPSFKKISACTLPSSANIKDSTAFQTGEGGGRGTLSAVSMPPVMAAGQSEVVPGDTFEDLHDLALIATITQSLPDPRHLTARLQIIERERDNLIDRTASLQLEILLLRKRVQKLEFQLPRTGSASDGSELESEAEPESDLTEIEDSGGSEPEPFAPPAADWEEADVVPDDANESEGEESEYQDDSQSDYGETSSQKSSSIIENVSWLPPRVTRNQTRQRLNLGIPDSESDFDDDENKVSHIAICGPRTRSRVKNAKNAKPHLGKRRSRVVVVSDDDESDAGDV